MDVANALDFSQGMPPTLSVSNADPLGEQIQRTFPEAMVVVIVGGLGISRILQVFGGF
jgi:8-hydroxy-5-deazaflavin:NADPH oxidoreductase